MVHETDDIQIKTEPNEEQNKQQDNTQLSLKIEETFSLATPSSNDNKSGIDVEGGVVVAVKKKRGRPPKSAEEKMATVKARTEKNSLLKKARETVIKKIKKEKQKSEEGGKNFLKHQSKKLRKRSLKNQEREILFGNRVAGDEFDVGLRLIVDLNYSLPKAADLVQVEPKDLKDFVKAQQKAGTVNRIVSNSDFFVCVLR